MVSYATPFYKRLNGAQVALTPGLHLDTPRDVSFDRKCKFSF